jgi:hypothetical protein
MSEVDNPLSTNVIPTPRKTAMIPTTPKSFGPIILAKINVATK